MEVFEIEKHYSQLLNNLHVNVTSGKKAPHKAILLLSVIDLIETGVIDNDFISFSKQIDKQFVRNWMRYVSIKEGYRLRSSVPFWHMSFEPYWNIILKEDCQKSFQELAEERVYNDYNRMAKVVTGAKIDNDLYMILQDSTVRAHYRVQLIKSYL